LDLALGRTVSLDELRAALQELLPGLALYVTDDPDFGAAPHRDVDVIATRLAAPDFAVGVRVFATMTRDHDFADWLRDLAASLSVSLQTRVLCDGSRYGDDASPYWSLVWDAGRPFLADDAHSLLVDGAGGAVRIVRALDLPIVPDRMSLAARVAPAGWS
jgi:hypothetical protein